jgi:hypothetical protein
MLTKKKPFPFFHEKKPLVVVKSNATTFILLKITLYILGQNKNLKKNKMTKLPLYIIYKGTNGNDRSHTFFYLIFSLKNNIISLLSLLIKN